MKEPKNFTHQCEVQQAKVERMILSEKYRFNDSESRDEKGKKAGAEFKSYFFKLCVNEKSP